MGYILKLKWIILHHHYILNQYKFRYNFNKLKNNRLLNHLHIKYIRQTELEFFGCEPTSHD